MAVLRPIDTPTIRADFSGVIGALRAQTRKFPDSAIIYPGFIGLAFVLEVWTRTQAEPIATETGLVLRHAYAHLSLGLLFAVLAAHPLERIWTLPRRLQRELTVLGLVFCGLHALRTVSGLEIGSIDAQGEISLALGIVALGGLLPIAASPARKLYKPTTWSSLFPFVAPLALFAALQALIAIGNASGLSGLGVMLATVALILARLRRPFQNVASQPNDSSGWTGNAIYAHKDENTKDTRTPRDNPTPIDPDAIDAETSRPEPQVVKRMRFQGPNFIPIRDYELDPDDGTNGREAEATPSAKPRQKHGTLEQSIISQLELLDQLEAYAGEAHKLSVLYRRSQDERVLRCSLGVNFDPLEDGWTALEVANQILEIVRRFSPLGLRLGRLEVRVYQERFRQGEQRRFERSFSFDLTRLGPPPLESPDQP